MIHLRDLEETIRIKKNLITSLEVVVASGKDGEYYVAISPSFLISGYGESEDKALDDFKYNVNVFIEDLNKISLKEKVDYIQSLGFKNDKLHKKNYSKVSIDDNGVLQGLERPSLKTLELDVV
ncbi:MULTISPECIES: hypothetical protein [Myroides]|uniref:HicB-like antitoxin of toxin-antitoxin system domain-containing protein n=1 Tax=Myroides odoratimimus CIP 101113 TaxID=883154 RepID=A0AAV3F3V7_9FLAO|nr:MULTISPECIES: hypothetical protein [Myroides]APA93267.1 hypothetical protein BK054_13735 [Myroides sp. ZB35]EHO12695.1 hypothetical protein HMPREF9715_01850 [Myroides odoratimimus CIP 101113]EKB07212.1 hypothetical protein HMPREF9711_00522 [Myroides odoratimimus CCUG 3837]EPH12266.1 hypothetical protein HMPREF9713_01107 [Myroides odoratimimus CCUG 12700]MDM1065534.1 hypothetical protein [Myroides odoratimimus]